MAFSVHCSTRFLLVSGGRSRSRVRCETNGKLVVGSPVIVVEAPRMIKTAASVPCLIVNSGLVNPGDVGRIVSRKPKDVWAVRLAIGTYLIDGKYFKALVLDDDDDVQN
uniref:Chlororespiratory reduction 42 n=1 Tax=Geranium maderense TaxID=28964 RepID=A0A0F7J3Z9_9ROSI|nr:chlororespiratory reduction 42 [Geranium maderense]